jgi:hypothetical protein
MNDGSRKSIESQDREFVDWLLETRIGCAGIDDCWMERGERSLRWWPHDYAETLVVERPIEVAGRPWWRILLEQEVAELTEPADRDQHEVLLDAQSRASCWQHAAPGLSTLVVVEKRGDGPARRILVERTSVWLPEGSSDPVVHALMASGSVQLIRSASTRALLSEQDWSLARRVSARSDGTVRTRPDGLYAGTANQVATLIPQSDLWQASMARCATRLRELGGSDDYVTALPPPLEASGRSSFGAAALMATLPLSKASSGEAFEREILSMRLSFVEARIPLKRLPFEPGRPSIEITVRLDRSELTGWGCRIRSVSPWPQMFDTKASHFASEIDDMNRRATRERLDLGLHRDVPRIVRSASRVRALDHLGVHGECSKSDLESGLRVDGLGSWTVDEAGLVRETFVPAHCLVHPDFPALLVGSHVDAHRWARSRTRKQLDAVILPDSLEITS